MIRIPIFLRVVWLFVRVQYHSTVGINTFEPKYDRYVLDVNGPIHIDNGEITIAEKPQSSLHPISDGRARFIQNRNK